MKTLTLLSTLLFLSAAAFAKDDQRWSAMEKCRAANPPPADRPERGKKPTDEQKAAVDAHREAIKTCMEAAGFQLPDRPQGPPPPGDRRG